ncbi:MAG: DNA polymerase III subunit delta [Candidatus Walczuchella monophlebidarum]
MEPHEKIIEDFINKRYKPIYFLMGEESYYIDLISRFIEKNILSKEEKFFNKIVLYGTETDIISVIEKAIKYPITSKYIVILLKEAQMMEKSIDKLGVYVEAPIRSTILVICYKNKVLDKNKKLYKLIHYNGGVVFNSKKYRESQIPDWISRKVKSMNRSITSKAQQLLYESAGTSLSTIVQALEKVDLAVPEGAEITIWDIEQYTGIKNNFNIVSWQRAIADKNFQKTQEISFFLGKNSKEFPLIFLINVLYRFFVNLGKYHISIPDTMENLSKRLNVFPSLIKDYEKAAHHYSLQENIKIFSYLREADKQSKGIDYPPLSENKILPELIWNICLILECNKIYMNVKRICS